MPSAMPSLEQRALPPDTNHGPKINGINWTFCAVATVVLGLRVFVRTRLRKAFGWDDL